MCNSKRFGNRYSKPPNRQPNKNQTVTIIYFHMPDTRISANSLANAESRIRAEKTVIRPQVDDDIVEVPDADSEIDSYEELTMEHGGHLAERELSCEFKLAPTRVQKAETAMEQMRERGNLDKLQRLLEGLRKQNSLSITDVLHQVAQLFDEPAEQDAALIFCANLLEGQGDRTGLAAKLRDAHIDLRATRMLDELLQTGTFSKEQVLDAVALSFKDQVEQEAALKICLEKLENRSDQSALAAFLFDARLELKQQLSSASDHPVDRSIWEADEQTKREVAKLREISTTAPASITELFGKVQTLLGDRAISDVLSLVIRSVGVDLQQKAVSFDQNLTKVLVDNLYQVQVLAGFTDAIQRIQNRMEQTFQPLKWANNPSTMLREILFLTEQPYPATGDVTAIVDSVATKTTGQDIYLLTQLTGCIRLLPLKIYPDLKNRDNLREVAQSALDELIAKENQ
jgi:hypothetical protein